MYNLKLSDMPGNYVPYTKHVFIELTTIFTRNMQHLTTEVCIKLHMPSSSVL
jgi:hypothetical protein